MLGMNTEDSLKTDSSMEKEEFNMQIEFRVMKGIGVTIK